MSSPVPNVAVKTPDPVSSSSSGSTYITKTFLEHALNKKWGPGSNDELASKNELKILKFNVSKGSALGDGYTTMLYTVDLWLQKEHEKYLQILKNWFKLNDSEALAAPASGNCGGVEIQPLGLIIKCFPDNPMRQEFLEDTEIFTTEVEVYENVTRDLLNFQKNLPKLTKVLRPPFAPFISGAALTTAEMKKIRETRPLSPVDNYVMMVDIRKHGDFKLVDRFDGLDMDHHKLTVEAHAKLHAISWAYKCKNKVHELRSLYPCLKTEKIVDSMKMMVPMMQGNIDVAQSIVIRQLKGDPDILRRLEELKSDGRIMDTFALYYGTDVSEKGGSEKMTKDTILRIPGQQVENEEPWPVLLHGDAWSNNTMFRYDPATGKPVQIVLLDLQVSREGDPMSDLSNSLYTGTTSEYRAKHLNSMLHVYMDTFQTICHHFDVPCLPNFTWDELTRRFHRSKIYGASIALLFLPLMLKNPDHMVDLETITGPTFSGDGQGDQNVDEKDGNFGGEASCDLVSAEEEERRKAETMKNFAEAFGNDLDYEKLHPVMIQRMRGLLKDMMDQGVL